MIIDQFDKILNHFIITHIFKNMFFFSRYLVSTRTRFIKTYSVYACILFAVLVHFIRCLCASTSFQVYPCFFNIPPPYLSPDYPPFVEYLFTVRYLSFHEIDGVVRLLKGRLPASSIFVLNTFFRNDPDEKKPS